MWSSLVASVGFLPAILLLMFPVLVVAMVATRVPFNVARKARTYFSGIKYMILSKDTTKKRAPLRLKPPTSPKTVRIIFVRHGESVWNSLFNKFDLQWPFRAVTSFVQETVAFFGTPHHSLIIDTPLSRRGEKQAQELAAYVKAAGSKKDFPMNPDNSVVVCSNLRRAMETALIGLSPRLRPLNERVLVDSALQEGSRNIDAQSLSVHRGAIAHMPIKSLSITTAALLDTVFEPRYNRGNKQLKGPSSNVQLRIDDFVRRAFGQGDDGLPDYKTPSCSAPDTLLVVGHSLWFKTFFNAFLPATSTHVSKMKKMQNCAVVSFDLVLASDGTVSITEGSINAMYKGF